MPQWRIFIIFVGCKRCDLVLRKTLKIFYLLAVILATAIAAAAIAVQSPKVQTYIAGKALALLEKSIDGRISIGKIHISPFKAVVIKDLAIIDSNPYIDSTGFRADTMFRAKYVTATFSAKTLLSEGSIHISSAKVTDGEFLLTIEPELRGCPAEADTSGIVNLKRIFRLGSNPDDKEKSDKEIFSISDVELDGMRFIMRNFRKDPDDFGYEGINWFDMDVSDIQVKGRNLKMKGGVMSGTCDLMSFREKSGYVCYHIAGAAKVGNGRTVINNFRLIDRWSNIDIPKFRMLYKDTDAWTEFIDEVRMEGDIKSSFVSMNTLRYFAPALKDFRMTAKVKGSVDGYVNDLHLNDIQFETNDADGFVDWGKAAGRGISGTVSGSLTGLPDVQTMLTSADIKSLSFTSRGLEHFVKGWAPQIGFRISNICKGSTATFSGKVSGLLNRMRINGTLRTGFGKARADVDMRNVIDSIRPLTFAGKISTDGLDIGKVAGESIPVGKCDMHTGLTAVIDKDTIGVTIDSVKIDRLDVLGYSYTGIAAAGTYSQDAFNGRIVCSDPNLNFLFQGIFSLSSKTKNALYRFYANLGYADLHALNIDKRGTSKMSFTTRANFTRVSGEDILGNISINDFLLEDERGRHDIGNIDISSHAGNDLNRIRFNSKFADGTYVGSKFLASFWHDIQTITTARNLPSIYADQDSVWNRNRYDIALHLHDTKDILSFFVPGVYIADSTSLNLNVDKSGKLKAKVKSGRIAYNDKYLKGIDLSIDNRNESLDGNLQAEEIKLSPVLTRNNRMSILARNDTLSVGFSYNNETELENRGEILADGVLSRDENDSLAIMANFRPSYIYLKSRLWNIASSDILLQRGKVSVDSLLVNSDEQSIIVDGGIATAEADTINLTLNKFDISLANAFSSTELGLKGLMTGNAMLISPTDDRVGILMNMTCDSTEFGGYRVGSVRAAGVWDEDKDGFNYFCRNTLDGYQTFSAIGNFYPKNKKVEGKIALDRFNIGYASPFLNSIFNTLEGDISGNLAFNGPYSEMDITSQGLRMDNVKIGVDFTNVQYTASGPVTVSSKGLTFDDVQVSDRFNEKGSVSGGILWNHLKDMAFDTKISFSRMEALNLKEQDNPLFYGNIFATGDLSVTGPLSSILISANARTVKKGDFHIPLSSSSSAGQSDLLTFTQPYREVRIDPYEELMSRIKEKDVKSSEFGVKLRLYATPDVTASIEIDKDAGNVLSGTGSGQIDLDVNPSSGNFTINGNYNITGGLFHFVALGIAKRDFTIQEGSSVHFNGDVMDSDLNINALYKTKASIGRLISDTTSTSRRTVECGISISDKLSNPHLAFTINIPDLDPSTQSLVESALNTQDKIQKQLLALLISNSFMPDEQSGITNSSSSMLYSNVTEIMAGQLNNILQKLNIPVDFGLDYQQNSGGTDIFDVALSTALFNNRVLVNGTIGNRQYNSSNSSGSEVVGDLDIDVKIDKTGSFRLNLFSHSADQYTNYLDNSQRNGVGLTYRREYDSFGEFIRNLFRSKKKRQEMEAARQQEMQSEKKKSINITATEPDKKSKRNGKQQ